MFQALNIAHVQTSIRPRRTNSLEVSPVLCLNSEVGGGWVGLPVLGHVLEHVLEHMPGYMPRHMLNHVLKQVLKYVPDKHELEHVSRRMPKHILN